MVEPYLLTSLHYFWSAGTWVEYVKDTYEYNTNNKETLHIYQENWNGSEWENSSREITSYNVFGDIEEEDNQNLIGGVWENYSRYIYNYDLNQNLEEKLHQNWNSGDWVNSDKKVYYWNEFDATIIEGAQNSYFNIYPNPTSDIVNVNNSKNNISSISITNVAGKVVYKNNKLNSKNNFINMKQYGNGIYLINIIDVNGNEINSKILVK